MLHKHRKELISLQQKVTGLKYLVYLHCTWSVVWYVQRSRWSKPCWYGTEARQNLNDIHEPDKFVSIQNPSEKFSEAQKTSGVHSHSMCASLLPQWHPSLCVMKLGVSFLKRQWKRREGEGHSVCRATYYKYVEFYVGYVAFRLAAENTCWGGQKTVLVKRISKNFQWWWCDL